MADIEKQGGPAFPLPGGAGDFTVQKTYLGMTLRDYFAAKAMSGLLAHGFTFSDDQALKVLVSESYEIADAMLASRLPSEERKCEAHIRGDSA